MIKNLDDIEDRRSLEEEEAKERKGWRDIVAGEDLKLEMDWRQRSRQLWLHEGDANTKFFHMSAIGRRRQNQITKVTVGDQEHVGSQAVGQALAAHYRSFSKKGKKNQWKCCGRGAREATSKQHKKLVRPFSEEEV